LGRLYISSVRDISYYGHDRIISPKRDGVYGRNLNIFACDRYCYG
jgi:DNA-binding Xre family transcriptional regulator